MAKTNRTANINCWKGCKDVGDGNLPSLLLWLLTGTDTGNQCGKSPQKLKMNAPYDPAIPFFGIRSKDSTPQYTCSAIFTTVRGHIFNHNQEGDRENCKWGEAANSQDQPPLMYFLQ